MSCAEDNLLDYPGDPWSGYSVLIHEFAHSVHLNGLDTVDPGFDGRLQAAFEAAIEKGLWIGLYASSNRLEYFAEGVTAWFNAHWEHFDINTRTKLKAYDPELAKLIAEVFGDTDWRYTPPATRTHLPHLQGFNPQDSPTFEFPPELAECNQQLYEPDGDCGKWVNLGLYDPSSFSPLRSPRISEGTLMTYVILVNTSGSGITYYRIDENGTEIYEGRHAFGLRIIGTEVGQIWLLKDQHGNDLGVFRAEEKTGRVFIGGETEEPMADSEPSSEVQQEPEGQPTTAVELEDISSSHDSVREDDGSVTITLTVTLDKAAGAGGETVTLAIVSPIEGKTAKRGEDFDATLDETITIPKGKIKGPTTQLILTPKDNTTADGDKAFAVEATSSSGHRALINIKIIDNDAAVESQAWLTPNPAEVEFHANDPTWKTFTVHTTLDSVLVRANPSGFDPAIEVCGGQQVPTTDYCPAEGNDRPTSGRRDGWNLHVKACQAGQTKILLIDYDTEEVVQQYEINVEASTGTLATTALNPNYPNPFNSETVLSYTLPTASDIRLEVFTLNGQRVAVLHEGFQAAGYHTIVMDASDLASGVYLYRLTTPEGRFVQKFTLLR